MLSVPVIAMAMVPALQFTYWQWASLVLAAPVVVWAAWPFHRAAWTNLRHGAATMDTLISVGTTAAFLWSLYALFLGTAGQPGMTHPFTLSVARTDGAANIYLEVAAGVTTFILAGRYFEKRSKRQAGAALRALLELGAKDVAVLRDGAETRIPITELTVGDEFVVRPGRRSRRTAPSSPAPPPSTPRCSRASPCPSRSVRATPSPGRPSTPAGGSSCARRASAATPSSRRWRASSRTRSPARRRSSASPTGCPRSSSPSPSRSPSAPWARGSGRAPRLGGVHGRRRGPHHRVPVRARPGHPDGAARRDGTRRADGVLIKGPEVLESTRSVDTVVLDKTGTVTTGVMTLADVVTGTGTDRAELLRLAGALEDASEHPVARAIARGAAQEVGPLPVPTEFTNVEGKGVQGVVDGRAVLVGRETLLAGWAQHLPRELADAKARAEEQGGTAVVVGWDGQARGILVVADAVKPTSAEAIRQLRALGLTPVLLTGDNATVARRIAAEVGIDEVIAEVMPSDKVDVVSRLQGEGKVVAMVGDGVNDAAALAQADLGLAMGTGTDVAIEAADITLVRGDLRSAADAIRLARRTLGTIKVNLFWAFAYNVAAIPWRPRPAQPDARRCRHGVLERLRGGQQPAPAVVLQPRDGLTAGAVPRTRTRRAVEAQARDAVTSPTTRTSTSTPSTVSGTATSSDVTLTRSSQSSPTPDVPAPRTGAPVRSARAMPTPVTPSRPASSSRSAALASRARSRVATATTSRTHCAPDDGRGQGRASRPEGSSEQTPPGRPGRVAPGQPSSVAPAARGPSRSGCST